MSLATIPATALRLITAYGTACTLSTNVPGTYNTATGLVEGSTTNSQNIQGVIEEYADNLRFLGDKSNPKNSIVEGDKKISIAASGLNFVPSVGDKITVNPTGIQYEIEGVGSMWSGQVVAVYVLHVSKR